MKSNKVDKINLSLCSAGKQAAGLSIVTFGCFPAIWARRLADRQSALVICLFDVESGDEDAPHQLGTRANLHHYPACFMRAQVTLSLSLFRGVLNYFRVALRAKRVRGSREEILVTFIMFLWISMAACEPDAKQVNELIARARDSCAQSSRLYRMT